MNLDRRLLQFITHTRAAFALAIGLGVLAGLSLVAQAYLLAQIVSRAFLDGADLGDLRGWLAALLAVAVGRALALWGSETAAHHVAGWIKADLRERLLAHLIALGPAYTHAERSGELVTTITSGIEELDAYFSQYLPQLALAALVPLATLAVVFPLDPLSGVVLLVTAPLIPFFMVLIGGMADRLTRRQYTQLSRLSAHFLDVLQGLPTLKIFGQARAQVAIVRRVSERFRDATMRVLRVAFLSALALELLATLSTAIIAVEIGLRLLYGRLAFDEAFFILILAPEFYLPLRLLGTRFHAGMAGVAAAARIFAVLETPADKTDHDRDRDAPMRTEDLSTRPSSRLPLSPPPLSPAKLEKGEPNTQPGSLFPSPTRLGRGWRDDQSRRGRGKSISPPYTVRFEGVHYAYADGTRPALHGVSFILAPGERVALVGPSGAGKSTIAGLLLRFIAPTGGRITVNEIDLRALPPDGWREQIAWVPQSPYLFAASAADNIRLARPGAPLADVIRAAEQAHADGFIRALPDGYNTPLGERGARLSGGQAQRIALARAFLKDAPLLILDEATAHLDPDTEELVQAAIHALLRDRAALVIAHRLPTVRAADRIVVLDHGRVAATGTHTELLATGGLYRRLVLAQGGPPP